MSVFNHPLEWAKEMDRLLCNGTINKDNYLTDCANAVVYVRETAQALASVTTERDELRDAVRKRDLAMSAHLKHCYEIEVEMDTVAKERDELLTRCGQIDGLKQRIAELNAMCDELFVENNRLKRKADEG